MSTGLPERPLVFECEGERLVGMLHPAGGELGVVVIVGGPQYRAGSHRHFVQLSRALAGSGHPVLRFDARGMGDSTGEPRGFEQITPDIGAAIDALIAFQPQLQRVVLWGLCDAASAALLYVHHRPDPRVSGICLLNPWVRSAQSLAKAHVRHYYLQRLGERDFWLKLLRGKVAIGAAAGLLRNVWRARRATDAGAAPASVFQQRMLAGWQAFGRPILVVLSGNDLTAKEFTHYTGDHPAWRNAMSAACVQVCELAGADHTFSQPVANRRTLDLTLEWLGKLGLPAQREPTGVHETEPRKA